MQTYIEMRGDKVKELREQTGMSRRDLAKAASISLSTLRSVEGGGRVQTRTARKVAHALGFEPSNAWGRVVRWTGPLAFPG